MKKLHISIFLSLILKRTSCATKKEFLLLKADIANTNARIDSTNQAVRATNESVSSLLDRITQAETKTTEAYKDIEHYQNGEKSFLGNAVADLQFRLDQLETVIKQINPNITIQKKQEEEIGKKKKTSY